STYNRTRDAHHTAKSSPSHCSRRFFRDRWNFYVLRAFLVLCIQFFSHNRKSSVSLRDSCLDRKTAVQNEKSGRPWRPLLQKIDRVRRLTPAALSAAAAIATSIATVTAATTARRPWFTRT